jgi:hypothetical protein
MDLSANGSVRTLTRVHDKRANADREHVDGTVLPLADWLVRNWFVIFGSTRVPPTAETGRRRAYRWMRSHCMRFAGEGAALPNLCLCRAGDDATGLQWLRGNAETAAREPVEFVAESGESLLTLAELEDGRVPFVEGIVRIVRPQARAPVLRRGHLPRMQHRPPKFSSANDGAPIR